jgi:sialate O-acetylesterase
MNFFMSQFAKMSVAAAIVLATCWSAVAAARPDDAAANFFLNNIYGSNMVLQRDREIVIAGFADPGRTVKVSFAGRTLTARSGGDCRWKATFPPLEAGGPYELIVVGKNRTVALKNILIGELWLASGQSNMEWPLANCTGAEAELTGADVPGIRFFSVPRLASPGVVPPDIKSADWQMCTPVSARSFSGVGYFFARELHRTLNVPVGVIANSWGGTPIECWIGANAFDDAGEANLAAVAREIPAPDPDEEEKMLRWRKSQRNWEDKVAEAYAKEIAAAAGFTARELEDESDWNRFNVPGTYRANGIFGNGVVVVRRDVEIPESWIDRELILSLGTLDDGDQTFVNGKMVGETRLDTAGSSQLKRRYAIPGEQVNPGVNSIAVRVIDYAGKGGFTGWSDEIFIAPADEPEEKIMLAGEWLAREEFMLDSEKVPPRPNRPPPNRQLQNRPGALYNGHVANLQLLPIRGVIWYQGESNANDAAAYNRLFPLLINAYRKEWNDPELAFIFAQLSAFERHTPGEPLPKDFYRDRQPSDSAWARLREAQTNALQLPNTGMAVTIDLGNPTDIHPADKRDVGVRMAKEALRIVYGAPIVSAGPLYDRMQIEDGAIRLFFKNAETGLAAKNGALRGFEIAGPDQVFHWAEAKIDGETVVVSSPEVKAPCHVRYAWSNNPAECNLYNQAGFPAGSFRTDRL